MRNLLLAATLFAGGIGCGRPETSAATTTSSPAAQAMVSMPSHLTLDPTQHGFCPRQWNCLNTNQFFLTQDACLAACVGGACEKEANCNGSCVCP